MDTAKHTFRRTVSFFLVTALMLTFVTPLFAGAYIKYDTCTTPIISISGDSTAICDADGNEIYPASVNTDDMGNLVSSVANVVLPLLIDGLLLNEWEPYYDAFEKEIGEIYSASVFDDDGNPTEGTGMSKQQKASIDAEFSRDNKNEYGFYDFEYYRYAYDWRVDPYVTADDLADRIDSVLKATGASKVNLVGRCLGGTVVLTYLDKYGTDKIRSITFDGTVANGCERLSEAFSGKFYVDMGAVKRWKADENAYKNMRNDPLTFLDGFIVETAELLEATGVGDKLVSEFYNGLYKKIYRELVSRLGRATIATWPGYWAAVKSCDYEDAKNVIFGEENSELRERYAGLIEKLDKYNVNIRQRIPEILTSANDSGVMMYVMAKYGAQMMPLYECYDATGDMYVSLACATFGATTSKLNTTLSDSYIAQRVAEGKGKYISPDKQVDTSTCVLPDQTWCFKGIIHYNWTEAVEDIIYRLISSDVQLTVDSLEDCPQFMVYDKANDAVLPMTAENAGGAVEWVDGQEEHFSKRDRLMVFLKWLFSIITFLFSKLGA